MLQPDPGAAGSVAGLLETAWPLDFWVGRFARLRALLAAYWFGRGGLCEPSQPLGHQPACNGHAGEAEFGGNRRPGPALTAPPAKNRASHLCSVRTETAKVAATTVADWPAITRARIRSWL